VVGEVPGEEGGGGSADAGRTGGPGGGKVFVLPVEAARQIRTDKSGAEAV
jgi:nitrogen regulatory protein PII